MGFDVWLLRVQYHILDAERSQCETVGVVAAIDTFYLFECGVGLGLLWLERFVVAWLHLCVGVIRRVRQLV